MSSEINKVLEAETPQAGMPQMFSLDRKANEFVVRHLKADLDDLGQLALLDDVETRAATGSDVVILTRDKFAFMSSYFVIIKYMEKTQNGR